MAAARIRFALAVAAAPVLLAACGSGAAPGGPSWTPAPSFNGEGHPPPPQQPGGGAAAPAPPGGSSSAPAKGGDPAVVAARLRAPTAVAILPDHSALVGERTTGRIVRVQPQPARPVVTVRTLPGISTAGGGGLLDLALSPNYDQDNLIFAYLTTARDNRVVAFTLHGPITPVVTGIPRGAADNTGRIAFTADGSLLVGTGDAGRPAAATNPASLAGKVLRVTDIGTPDPANPNPRSPVFAAGFGRTDGLCTDPGSGAEFQTEAVGARAAADPVRVLTAGASYRGRSAAPPLAVLPSGSRAPGGCAVLGHVLFVTSRDGKELLSAPIRTTSAGVGLGTFAAVLRNTYGRLLTVVASSDGSLWLTTSNRDGHGTPVAADERVLRIIPESGSPARDAT